MPSAFGMALLESLTAAPWMVAARTIGNDHATLIGLLVHWWIINQPQTRWVIESGPSFGYHEKGIGGGMCDAIFCEGAEAVGILEVEGIRSVYTAQKIGK